MSQIWLADKVLPVTELWLDEVVGAGLAVGDAVRLTAFSKGRGFAGVVKRHGFAGGPKTHGQSDRWRAPGSIGGTTTPGRVYKGKRMAGRLGGGKVTVKSTILEILGAGRRLVVKGPVSGSFNSSVYVEKVS